MPQPFFLFFWCVALVLLLRLGGFEDIDELPTVLRPWFRVHPGYLDDFTFVCSKLRSGDPLVGLTLEIALDQDRWCLDFQGLTDYAEFLLGLWLAIWEHNLVTQQRLVPLVSALLTFSRRLLPGGTMSLQRERPAERASEDTDEAGCPTRTELCS